MCMRFAVLIAALISLFTAAGVAQPLAEQVPADAVVYFGWCGNEAMGKGFESSHLNGVLQSTNMQQRLATAVSQLAQIAGKKDPAGEEAVQTLAMLGSATWKYPFAIYVRPAPAQSAGDAPPRLVVLWQAGEQAPAFLAQLQPILDKAAAKNPNAGKAIQVGPFVAFFAGTTTEAEVRAGKPASPLTGNSRFQQAITNAVKDPAAIAYVDGEGLIELINRSIEHGNDPAAQAKWPKTRDALGLSGVKRLVWSASFDGADWATQLFIDAPAPRKGIVALLDGPPISASTLKLAPKDAVWVSAMRLDLAGMVEQVRSLVTAVKPESVVEFNKGLLMAGAATGVDIEQLLGGFGPEWLVYTDPASVGPSGMGFVVVNPLRDVAKVEVGLVQLEQVINQRMAAQAGGEAKMHFEVLDQEGVKVHSINVMVLAPSWAVHEQKLYFGLAPQAVVEAAAFRKKQEGSILDNEKYAALRQRLGGKEAGAVRFVDLPQTAVQAYQGMVMAAQMLGAVLQQQGIENPLPALLPPLSAIRPHLAPSGSVSWTDERGYFSRSLSPFPGADLLAPQGSQMSAAQVAFGVGIMLPAIGAARRTAQQMQAGTQLRGIHQGMILYSQAHDQTYPDHMGQLLEGQFFTKEYTLSPTALQPTPFPADFDQWPSVKKGQWLAEHGSYVILRWGKKPTNDFKTIVGYLKPTHIKGVGISVAFDDNHVEFIPLDHAVELIRKQYPDHQIELPAKGPPPVPIAPETR